MAGAQLYQQVPEKMDCQTLAEVLMDKHRAAAKVLEALSITGQGGPPPPPPQPRPHRTHSHAKIILKLLHLLKLNIYNIILNKANNNKSKEEQQH